MHANGRAPGNHPGGLLHHPYTTGVTHPPVVSGLPERFAYGVGGLATHAGQHVAVGVQCDGYGGVT